MNVLDMMYKSLANLLGDGLAWALRATNMKSVIESMLSINQDIRRFFIRISRLPFPTIKSGLLPDDDRTDEEWESDIENLENQFGIVPNFTDTLVNRSMVAESQWGLIGSQARGYIQQALEDAGIPVYVKENIPAKDLFALNANQYGLNDYGFDNYSSGSIYLLGNGLITTDDSVYDPVAKPISIYDQYGYQIYNGILYGETYNQWISVFIIESENWQERAVLTQSQYDSLIFILLKIKPLHTLAFLNVEVT